jgi:hypothetical protein
MLPDSGHCRRSGACFCASCPRHISSRLKSNRQDVENARNKDKQLAVYRYATTGQADDCFPQELVKGAFKLKRG